MVETIEDFKERWATKIKEIKRYPLDATQCKRIEYDFGTEFMSFEILKKKHGELTAYTLVEIRNDLNLALEIAYSKYKLEMRKTSWWSRLFGGDKHLHYKG